MDHTRHIDLYDVHNASVSLVGAGGIGATTGIALAKMGIAEIYVYDMDLVGTENLATQLHKLSDVGSPKVSALTKVILEYADYIFPYAINERVTQDTVFLTKYVISAVDNIQTRKDIWKSVTGPMSLNVRTRYFIDARMSAEEFHLYVVDLHSADQRRRYAEMIDQESDENVPDVPCTMKATIYTAFMAAGHICNAVKKLEMDEKHPFSVIHNIKTFTFLAG